MYEYNSVVERIVDGDTLDASIDLGFDIWYKSRIRLAGIDTWESRTRDLEEKKKGLAAKARLKDLLKKKKFILRTSKDGKGKFGRILGVIIIKDENGQEINANDKLVEEGHAYPYGGGNKEEARADAMSILNALDRL